MLRINMYHKPISSLMVSKTIKSEQSNTEHFHSINKARNNWLKDINTLFYMAVELLKRSALNMSIADSLHVKTLTIKFIKHTNYHRNVRSNSVKTNQKIKQTTCIKTQSYHKRPKLGRNWTAEMLVSTLSENVWTLQLYKTQLTLTTG